MSKHRFPLTSFRESKTCLVLPVLVLLVSFIGSTTLVAREGNAAGDRERARSSDTRAGGRHFVRDFPPRDESGRVNVVIEIPAGTNAKWEVAKQSGLLEWEQRDGRPRVVDYLAYPGNYGMVPRTLLPAKLGGDGDPLDVIILGPALERGSVVAVRLIGVLELLDGGEQDDKLIAVLPGGALGELKSLAELDERYRGVTQILKLWFSNYKGPGVLETKGFGDRARAYAILDSAIHEYSKLRE